MAPMSATDKRLLLPGLLLIAILLAAGGWMIRGSRGGARGNHLMVADRPGVRGTLLLSIYGERVATGEPRIHTSVLVNGPDYSGMEDNDLRGFLDGNFKWGWNQPGQKHVRVGRRGSAARYGEFEIFRVLERWDGPALPPLSEVHSAALTIEIEKSPDRPSRVMLYEVKKDWDPGGGGVNGDNVSPPRTGEVWWNDLGFGEEPWGLPGVGFASDDHLEADTGAMPLDQARHVPGKQLLEFRSTALTEYAARRVRLGKPLLFLLKLSDYHEDLPGSMMALYSGNHGDSRNVKRRPYLTLEWSSPAEESSLSKEVFLEYGRSYRMPRMETSGEKKLAISFRPTAGYASPSIEVRGGSGNEISPWFRWPASLDPGWSWLEVKLLAASDPHVLGQPFRARLVDTWVRTAPPEDQEVWWTFTSPTGIRHDVQAAYLGDYQWEVEFHPDELGPWTYSWADDFTDRTFVSAPGEFDVLAGDESNIEAQLRALTSRIEDLSEQELSERRESLMIQFSRLERSVMQLQTPDSFRRGSGVRLRGLLNEVRGLLDKPAPERIEMVPSPPAEWQKR